MICSTITDAVSKNEDEGGNSLYQVNSAGNKIVLTKEIEWAIHTEVSFDITVIMRLAHAIGYTVEAGFLQRHYFLYLWHYADIVSVLLVLLNKFSRVLGFSQTCFVTFVCFLLAHALVSTKQLPS